MAQDSFLSRHYFDVFCILVTFLCGCSADKELIGKEYSGAFDSFTKDIFKEIHKRLSGYDDYGMNYDSDVYGDQVCNFQTSVGLIIKTTDSVDAGAEFLRFISRLDSRRECRAKCCETKRCNLAVFKERLKEGEEHNCYLFDCDWPSVCTFSNHTGYVSMGLIGGHKLTNDQHEKHESDLAQLAETTTTSTTTEPTTTTSTTTSTTTTTEAPPESHDPVPLFGKCSTYKDCAGAGTDCLAGYCVCNEGYHPQDGLCRKDCTRFQFECVNKDRPLAVPQCVAIYDKCDGTEQCQDGSDEEDCQNKGHGGSPLNQNKVPNDSPGDAHKLTPGDEVNDGSSGNDMKSSDSRPPQATNPNGIGQNANVKTESAGSLVPENEQNADMNGGVQAQVINTDDEQSPAEVQDQKPEPVPEETQSAVKDTAPVIPQPDVPLKNTSTVVKIKAEEEVPASDAEISSNLLSISSSSSSSSSSNLFQSSQGAVIALGLGLSITALLLVFVGCRLRTVKKRLRRGRPLNSGEADYLINGMYL